MNTILYFNILSLEKINPQAEQGLRLKALASNESALAHFILKSFLATHLSLEFEKLEICSDVKGKPFLADHPEIHLSISHSAEHILVAISSAPIGLDIEQERKVSEQLIKRCLSTEELQKLDQAGNNREATFLKIWTEKEAYLKFLGTGFLDAPAAVDVSSAEIQAHLRSLTIENATASYYSELSPEVEFNFIQIDTDTLIRFDAQAFMNEI